MRVLKSGVQGLSRDESFDVVIVGAGGAGLSAAVFAAMAGASVLLVERTAWVGGTTAWSAGTSWIPGNPYGAVIHPQDHLEQAQLYLNHVVGTQSAPDLRQAFLQHGHAAVSNAERGSFLKYRPYAKHPDYHSELPGASLCGRALEPVPFDGRLLGEHFALLRPPIPEFTVLGGMMVDRTDIGHLLAMRSSWTSFKHSLRLLARHARDRLYYERGTRLVMGNAHVGRLFYSLLQQPAVTLLLNTEVQHAEHRQQGQYRLSLQSTFANAGSDTVCVDSNKALMLASGGFNRHAELRAALMPGVPVHWSPGAPGHTGQAHAWAKALGAVYGSPPAANATEGPTPQNRTHGFWAPVSLRQRKDGSTAVFPHFVMDRAKPGVLAVNALGQRFVNESTSYHLFALAMLAQPQVNVPACLIADARALRKYGLGMVRPGSCASAVCQSVQDGYLTQGQSLEALAQQLGIPCAALQATVRRFNQMASAGRDDDFGRGETEYQKNLGDGTWSGPNPNLGPLQEAPFYAVRLYPGDIGASTGFLTNANAQMLRADQSTIPGLYALGNDMQSIMGGVYPAPGITLGPGLVFAHLAVIHALQETPDQG